MNNLALLTSADTKAGKVYSDDVFSSFLYTGTGTTQTINNGLDLAGKGGLVWCKSRTTTLSHILMTTSTSDSFLQTNTGGPLSGAILTEITGYTSTGFSLGAGGSFSNPNNNNMVAWSFRNSQNFYHHTVLTKSTGSNASFTFSTIATLGMVRVKRTDAAGSWYIWHRSLSAGQLMIGETTAAAATLGHITVSGNTVTLVNGVIADGTYLVEAFGHDTSADGIIQCGSVTSTGGGTIPAVNLGWEPQYILYKNSVAAWNWEIWDNSRNWSIASTGNATANSLKPNLSDAESLGSTAFTPTATGFFSNANFGASQTFIYMAIRRPNKPPTLGTQVYNAIIGGNLDLNVGFVPDSVWWRLTTDILDWKITTRLLGISHLKSNLTDVEVSQSNEARWDTTTNTWKQVWYGGSVINHFFKRAPGVMDIVCYTGTGASKTEAHNLGAVPELVIFKVRTGGIWDWAVYASALGLSNNLYLNQTTSVLDMSLQTAIPTASVLNLATSGHSNGTSKTYVAYLFATKAGISKVGSYTGNGTSQNIDMGFSTGARFFLVKSTSTTGSWWVFDTTRGIISAADPALQLNSTAAEITTADCVDPYLNGISVTQEATCSINATGVDYIYLAIA